MQQYSELALTIKNINTVNHLPPLPSLLPFPPMLASSLRSTARASRLARRQRRRVQQLSTATAPPQAATTLAHVQDMGDLRGARVLARFDFNVPLDKSTGAISDEARIEVRPPARWPPARLARAPHTRRARIHTPQGSGAAADS